MAGRPAGGRPGWLKRGRESARKTDQATVHWRTSPLVMPFRSPLRWLAPLDANGAAALIASASDLALAIDEDGVVRDIAIQADELQRDLPGSDVWPGRPWSELVTVESRPKVEALRREAGPHAAPRWRHINYPAATGPDVPILTSALRLGEGDRIVAFGRDLRGLSVLQQRLVEAQHAMERDYARLRQAELRYRLLFQIGAEPILVVDAATRRIVEANAAAEHRLAGAGQRLAGRGVLDLFDPATGAAVAAQCERARSLGHADPVQGALAESAGAAPATIVLMPFRQDKASLLLVRIGLASEAAGSPAAVTPSPLLALAEHGPDAGLVVGLDGRIIAANQTFLDMAGLYGQEQVRGQPLDRWLGRRGVDIDVLLGTLRQHGAARLYATVLRGEHGTHTDVEISATTLPSTDPGGFVLSIRNVERRLGAEIRVPRETPRSVEQLTELIGRVPLKDLVRESTDMIERLCIETALEMSGDNRAAAAEMLGLSRQSLYVKLRRYGLGDLDPEPPA